MLQKIDDIHSLEVELVKIEDTNSSQLSKLNKSASSRNEEVMGEIRNMLKEMISTSPNSANLMTVNNIYEEYSKTVRHHHHHNRQSPKTIRRQQQHEPSSETTTETEYIYKRFETFRSQIQHDYFNLLSQAKHLEDLTRRCDDHGSLRNELGNFRHNLKAVQENLEREKFYLFKSFQGLNANTSRVLIGNLGDNIEKLLYDKHTEFDSIVNKLYSLVGGGGMMSAESQVGSSNGSFLGEEEDAIKVLSEKVRVLKTKIDEKVGKANKRLKSGHQVDL